MNNHNLLNMNVFIALCLVDLVYGNKCEPLCVRIFVFPTSFDLLAVGGISVTLLFQRAPFLSQIRSVWLPWNQFMVLDRVIMERAESKPPVCDLKNLISPHAIVLSAPLPRDSLPTVRTEEVSYLNYRCETHSLLRKHWMQYLSHMLWDYTRINVTQVSCILQLYLCDTWNC